MNYKEYNDSELLSYIKEENEQANEIMFNKYKPLIKSLANKYYSRCINKGFDLSDLIQEGMVGLSYAITSFKDDKDTSFYTYAKTCIERKILSAVIGNNRLKNKILNESISFDNTTNDCSLVDLIGDNSVNPENMAIRYENEQEIHEYAKSNLTPKEFQVFELKLSGFNYKEIADILETDYKNVDNALQRIKNKLRKMVK